MKKQTGITIFWCFVLWAATRLFPDQLYLPLFCEGPARLAAGYYGSPLCMPLSFTARGITLETARSCGATDFFVMVFMILPPRWWRLFAAYGITLLTNTARLIILIPATAVIHASFPERFYSLGHQVVGTAVFLPALVLIWEGVRYVKRRKHGQCIH
ncbi:MAG: hypothetical protein WC334_01050 [Kiritimatiellales bacterium]|jgi:exosortase/archaeosortase family protein